MPYSLLHKEALEMGTLEDLKARSGAEVSDEGRFAARAAAMIGRPHREIEHRVSRPAVNRPMHVRDR